MAELYLLHFDRPFWARAQHYVGYTKFTAQERIDQHLNGNGSKLVAYALKQGCTFQCVLVERFDTPEEARKRERQLKARHGLKKICPLCREGGASGKTLQRNTAQAI